MTLVTPIIRILLVSLACWMFTAPVSLAATMPAVQVTFIDAESEEPIANANVIFFAESKEGTFTGDGGSYANLFLVEGVTNEAGVINFPAQSFWPMPFLLNSNNHMPSMYMYKYGYELAGLYSLGPYPASTNAIISWAKRYTQPIKVKKTRTTLGLFELVDSAGSVAERSYLNKIDHCAWKKIPKFLLAIESGAIEWKSRPKEEGWYKQAKTYSREPRNPVADLILSEGNERRLFNCGKPSDFFETFRHPEQ